MKLPIIITTFLLTLIGCNSINNINNSAIAQRLFNRPDFFEWGNQQMDTEIQRLQDRSPQNVLTITEEAKPELQWLPFVVREGDFSIWMPLGAFSEETEVLKTETGAVSFKVFASHPQSSRFIVAYSELIESEKLEDREAVFAILRDDIIDRTEFQLDREEDIECISNPGKQLSLAKADETITIRLCLADDRVYVMGVSQPNAGASPEAIATFFDSFLLLE